MNKTRKITITALAAAIGAAVLFGGTASAANTVDTYDIVNGTIQSIDVKQNDLTGLDIKNGSLNGGDIRPGAITETQLHPSVKAKLNPTPADAGFEADGPYPGATDLGDMEGQGDNSDSLIQGDEGASEQEVWVQCADGKVAIGGGFQLAADAGLALKKDLQVTASEPAQVRDGALVYEPIEGDEAGSVKPNAWRVAVIHSGTQDAIVRPFVVCVAGS